MVKRLRSRKEFEPFSQINVTPLVDVMLVLLIVFMITAPLLTVGVSVDLPQSRAPAILEPNEPVVITIKKDGNIFFQESKIEQKKLIFLLQEISQENADMRIFIRADRSLRYENVLKIMGDLVAAGFEKVALVSDIEEIL